ncbi:agmatinase [Natranaerovirga hydrolytica]|uniref:Agmatinase n=1 Tax=Natranaerovirga hydrolytica TaxID=680378 RepID=A0A4R1N168_9FIRM|nr:agmatinase [Natranaerovirga hydrolytica]TCK97734.1 agmatinase [Natranaerovirga hydrolytica]
MNKNVLTFIGCDSDYDQSDMVLFGAPFDGTTSFRPGTRFASDAIRKDSDALETYSPYIDRDLADYYVIDVGDIDLTLGNTQKVLDEIYTFTKKILNDKKIPFMVGGEHLVTLPAVKAVYEKYNDLMLIHLDAHTDLRDELYGERLSHATVIKRVWEYLGDDKIYQYGIRSGEKHEFEWAKEHTQLVKFTCRPLLDDLKKFKDTPIYLTIDLDVLDPSVFPGTGTPEPGGIFFSEILDIIQGVTQLNIVALDVVELSPHYDMSGVSTAVACKIIRELMVGLLSKENL